MFDSEVRGGGKIETEPKWSKAVGAIRWYVVCDKVNARG